MKIPNMFSKLFALLKGGALLLGLKMGAPVEQTVPPVLPVTIIELQSNQQAGPTCGHHAAFNAKAIQDLFYKKKPIDQRAIQQQARTYFKHLENHDLEIAEIILNIGQKIGLKNVYFLGYDHKKGVFPAGVMNEQEDLDSFFATVHKKRSFLAHFICNTGGHWILFSLFKQKSGISIAYLDSINRTLKHNSVAQIFVEYLYKKTIS